MWEENINNKMTYGGSEDSPKESRRVVCEPKISELITRTEARALCFSEKGLSN